jgi:hypothetical protein
MYNLHKVENLLMKFDSEVFKMNITFKPRVVYK